jgi:CDP-6-deoxy-D-xylo-4-hexulose-3-dehydrase
MSAVVDSALDGWFTTGRWAKEFERKLAQFVGVRSASLVNSGSSANLVALSALTSPKLGARASSPAMRSSPSPRLSDHGQPHLPEPPCPGLR